MRHGLHLLLIGRRHDRADLRYKCHEPSYEAASGHSLFSYLFNTVMIAAAVNVVVSLRK
jgi:hypothetical protein